MNMWVTEFEKILHPSGTIKILLHLINDWEMNMNRNCRKLRNKARDERQ